MNLLLDYFADFLVQSVTYLRTFLPLLVFQLILKQNLVVTTTNSVLNTFCALNQRNYKFATLTIIKMHIPKHILANAFVT